MLVGPLLSWTPSISGSNWKVVAYVHYISFPHFIRSAERRLYDVRSCKKLELQVASKNPSIPLLNVISTKGSFSKFPTFNEPHKLLKYTVSTCTQR